MKITFEILRDGTSQPQPIHEIDLADDGDGVEDQLLIGLCIEVHGERYKVVNQIIDASEDHNIVYYVQAATKNTA